MGNSQNLFLNGCIRRQDQVVLVHSHAVISFTLQYTHNLEGQFLETDHLPDRIFSAGEQVIHHRLPDNADFGCNSDVLLGEHLSVFYFITTDFHIIRTDTINRSRRVVSSVNNLSTTIDRRRNSRHVTCLIYDVLIIFKLQCFHARSFLTYTAPDITTRLDHNHI